jgi:plasmid maintenance system antidote protein VapI
MLSEQIIQILNSFNLTHQKLADLLGVKLQRIRNISAGNVKKLTREEAEVLVKKLHIRGDWLATGEGPMLQSESERAFYERVGQLKYATDMAASLPLSEAKQQLLQELLFYAQAGDVESLTKIVANCEIVRPDQAALLDNLENCSKEDQDAIRRMALLAASADNETKPNKKAQMKKAG